MAGFGDGEPPVVFGDARTPLRVDTITAQSVATLSLLWFRARRPHVMDGNCWLVPLWKLSMDEHPFTPARIAWPFLS